MKTFLANASAVGRLAGIYGFNPSPSNTYAPVCSPLIITKMVHDRNGPLPQFHALKFKAKAFCEHSKFSKVYHLFLISLFSQE